jgi:uncharacterized SAM-binding protein YcdF (DUF218 family)
MVRGSVDSLAEPRSFVFEGTRRYLALLRILESNQQYRRFVIQLITSLSHIIRAVNTAPPPQKKNYSDQLTDFQI